MTRFRPPETVDRLDCDPKIRWVTSWRIGYAAGHSELVRVMAKVQSQLSSGANRVSQWAAVAALNGSCESVAEFVRIYDERRRLAAAPAEA